MDKSGNEKLREWIETGIAELSEDVPRGKLPIAGRVGENGTIEWLRKLENKN